MVKPGPKKRVLTPEEIEQRRLEHNRKNREQFARAMLDPEQKKKIQERRRRNRAAERQRKIDAGIDVSPGRPRIHATDEDRTRHHRQLKNNRRKESPILTLASSIRNGIWLGLFSSGYFTKKTKKFLGIETPEKYKEFLSASFTEGMSWDNYGCGEGKWSIDHVIPTSVAQNKDDLLALMNYRNTQPLWNRDNLKKGNRVMDFSVLSQETQHLVSPWLVELIKHTKCAHQLWTRPEGLVILFSYFTHILIFHLHHSSPNSPIIKDR